MLQNRSIIKYFVAILIFIVFIIFVNESTGWDQVFFQLKKLNAVSIFMFFLLLSLSYLTRSLRIYSYFKTSFTISFLICLKVSLYHNFLNNILPMRTGEISYPIFLSKHLGIPFKPATASLLWFRLLDLIALTSFGILSLSIFTTKPAIIYALSTLVFLSPILVYIVVNHIDVQKLTAKNIAYKLFYFLLTCVPSSRTLFLTSWFYTLVTWALKLAVFTWFISHTLQINLANSLLASITSEFTSVLPIHSFAGFGTYEAGIIAVLAPLQMADSKSVIATATSLHIIILSSTILSVILFKIYYSFKTKNS